MLRRDFLKLMAAVGALVPACGIGPRGGRPSRSAGGVYGVAVLDTAAARSGQVRMNHYTSLFLDAAEKHLSAVRRFG